MHSFGQTNTKNVERLETARRLAEQIATTLGPNFKRLLLVTEDRLDLFWTLDTAIDGARDCLARYHTLLNPSFEERRRIRERNETIEDHLAAVASLLVKCYRVLHQAGHQRRQPRPKAQGQLVLLRGGRS